MKKISAIIGGITAISLAVKNMGDLTYEQALSYGLILLFSFIFIKNVWKLIDRKT